MSETCSLLLLLPNPLNHFRNTFRQSISFSNRSPKFQSFRISLPTQQATSPSTSSAAMNIEPSEVASASTTHSSQPMKLLFVEMGVGYDQHGQNITAAAMRACRDAISSNSIPAFRRGSIPGVSFGEMKLQIKLGVPHSLQTSLDIEKVKSVFPYGKILDVEVVDGGLICSSGVHVEEMGDKNDDCYIVNAAVYAAVMNWKTPPNALIENYQPQFMGKAEFVRKFIATACVYPHDKGY